MTRVLPVIELHHHVLRSEQPSAADLAETIGMKGDGKTRLLGFGLPNATYELEGHKFLTGQPLIEKAVSVDHPQLRIPAKMKRVQAGIRRWHARGKDPSAVGRLMEGAQPLADGGKLAELEKLVDQALDMLGETSDAPDVYGNE
ncbi:MAG: hypothetical protein ACYC3X_22900 [Pirellulaceae bacterium]